MEILLHICCAPCATYSARHFGELGYQVRGFFFNPNIHPYGEYRRRLDTLTGYCNLAAIPLVVRDRYDPESYLREVMLTPGGRCAACYRLRLAETAREAARLEVPYFSTTLAVSPYQDHDLLRSAGEEAGRRHGAEFIYRDLRQGFGESVAESRQLGLYRQRYCGCLFSEWESYHGKSGRVSDA